MAATLELQHVVVTGLNATLAPADAVEDTMRVNLGAFLYVDNADGDPHTVTVVDPHPDGTDLAVVVADGTAALIGPIDSQFRDRNDGYAHITYDDVTSVTVAALVCPRGARPSHPSGTSLTTQEVDQDGLVPNYTAAAGGQKIKPGIRVFAHVKNGDASAHTITTDDPTSDSPPGAIAFNPDVLVSVPAGESRWIGPFDRRFGDPDDTYRADITWSATTSMTIAVFDI